MKNNPIAQEIQLIGLENGHLVVPPRPTIPFVEGDGSGPDIWRAARRVLDAAVHALAPNGILMLGRTESLVALPEAGLIPVDVTHRLYRRLP